MPDDQYLSTPCNIIIVGASGDLTNRKLIPALFSLHCNNLLPEDTRIFGFARTELTDDEFREKITSNLTCRYVPEGNTCDAYMESFLARCYYHAGAYASKQSFDGLAERIRRTHSSEANNLFYMAIPPSLFLDTADSIKQSDMMALNAGDNWTRVVLEKPFGRDSASSAELLKAMAQIFEENQTYRIDHYLGKEVIQNLMILRFANLVFEPIWNHHYIEEVSISWSETIGCQGRAGYFDYYGIIRDVMQNHLLQILALVGMEQPIKLSAEAIRDEKVKLLKCVPPIKLEKLVVGQYTAGEHEVGYLEDKGVPQDSITPTYAQAELRVDNQRWYGVPFVLTCGKALDSSKTEIKIKFKPVPYSIFRETAGLEANVMTIRVQPNEAVELDLVNKLPGFGFDLEPAKLNLHYSSSFNEIVPDAYERLLLDVLRGDRSLFLRDDELAASWDIVTPALHALEENRDQPIPYEFGSEGPVEERAV